MNKSTWLKHKKNTTNHDFTSSVLNAKASQEDLHIKDFRQ